MDDVKILAVLSRATIDDDSPMGKTTLGILPAKWVLAHLRANGLDIVPINGQGENK
jgi:hypothetical protein